MAEKLVAIFLALVGLAYFALLIALHIRGELRGDVKISAVLFCIGAILLGIGCAWLLSKAQAHESVPSEQPDPCLPLLLKMRRAFEFGAIVGLVLVCMHAVELLIGAHWVPKRAVYPLIAAPILIYLFTLRILPPGAFRSGLFSEDTVSGWSGLTRKLVGLLIRLGWFGYPAIVLSGPSFRTLAPWIELTGVQFILSLCTVLLYASQLLVLHFGQVRPAQTLSREEGFQ